MGSVQVWAVSAAGAAVLLVVLRDVFHTLWHPSGRGQLSRRVMAVVWWAGRRPRARGRASVLAGPLALVVVVFAWVALTAVGFALVYWPHLADGFALEGALEPQQRRGFLDALYVSLVTLVTLGTLGFGDIVPTADWLRIVVPVQALLGFALLTAAVSWVLQIHPALVRRRALALRLSLLRRVDSAALLTDPQGQLAAPVLADLAADLAQARIDLTQYAETYYFRDSETESSLPAVIEVAVLLSATARTAPRADVRVGGELLAHAVADFSRVVDAHFLNGGGGSVADVLAAYAADHGHGTAHRR
ncbi:potassium channel family protein [Modestobacter sp. VKM Ac-2984]|uniref:potassium channel family protein n=1 Tax=Modestobacter sp. VKM Ac-2984 TaxID=3004138 RepID=UPI0022AA400C|nr:potassium channel family protein [Modestobacter sp. VKM Ac-2984]MCZ2818603.1 potassium channel family protein [Modestobacter sp. VKM Ac-2984]